MDIFNPFTLKGKTILVTGASSGIGRGIAIACSKMGAFVIINGRNEQRLAETLREMRGEENLSLIADLSQTDAVAIMVRQLPNWMVSYIVPELDSGFCVSSFKKATLII